MCTSERMTAVPSFRVRWTTSVNARMPLLSSADTLRMRMMSTYGLPATRARVSLNAAAAPKKKGPLIS